MPGGSVIAARRRVLKGGGSRGNHGFTRATAGPCRSLAVDRSSAPQDTFVTDPARQAVCVEALEARLADAGLTPIPVEDPELGRFLEGEGRLVRVGDGLAIGIDAYERAKSALVDECRQAGSITLARFRDLLGISRRPAQLLLERFDADGLTRRVGDERVLRRGATIDR